jgi:glycosyltransferase involved in cell wall biosynthesis
MARILINHSSGMPNKVTGISVYTFNLLEALARVGRHDYVFATNWDIDRLPSSVSRLDIEFVHRSLPVNEARAIVANTIELAALRRKLGCEAIFHPQPTAALTRLGKDVLVVHDLYRVSHKHLFNWKQRLQWRFFVAPGIRSASQLIAVSEATRQATIEAYPETKDRVTVVHEASPIAAMTLPKPRPTDDGYILLVANITPNKNVGAVIEALKILADRGERPLLRIAGRDEYGVLPGLIGARTDLNIDHQPGVSDARLRELYAGAGVYINTSLVEGFCLPLLEAQTCGLPVICSDLPVLREVAGNGALFVDPMNAINIAAKMSDVLADDRLRDSLSTAGHENVSRFSWEKAARGTEAVIDKALK